MNLNVEQVKLVDQMAKARQDFPILQEEVNGQPLIYLDNGATSQKPEAVIGRISNFYRNENANINRGVHTLGNRATTAFENARLSVQDFINAREAKEIIFTSGTTESLNWIAAGWAKSILQPGDVILLTRIEHHANFVPWQEVAKVTGATLEFLPLTASGRVDVDQVEKNLQPEHKIMAVNHVSNVLGEENPIQDLADLIHANDGFLVVDGAQAVPHLPVDVQALGADFYAFSSHKMTGPTGFGVLYGKRKLLEDLQPQNYGGEMITQVLDYESRYADLPYRLEGGTPHIAGAVGTHAAIDYLKDLGMVNIQAYEQLLVDYVLPKLKAIEGVTVYGNPNHRSSALFSFNIEGVHPHDVATAFDQLGIAVRAGHHCAQPLMREFDIQSSVRASFYFYNTLEEADRFLEAIEEIKEFFGHGTI